MMAQYNIRTETIETVYTYEEWLKEYNRRETKRRLMQKTEHLYYIKQRIAGAIMTVIGIVALFVLDGDATFSFVAVPLGIFLMMAQEKVVTF